MPTVDRGILVIVSSPSGAGKTTLTRRLLTEFSNLGFSISFTTRPMRPGEVDGSDYHFVSAETFETMVERGEFAEYAWVHGNRYGTARGPINTALDAGRDLIFDVDWQGGGALSDQWPADALKVFILPPDLNALAERLRRRATDAPEVIDRRLHKAIEELAHFHEYQHLIVNDDVDRAYAILRAIYLTRRYGRVDRVDVPYPLAQLAAQVDDSLRLGADEHARALIRPA
ncbi:MAG: guanylate kinase [Kofleriaceae bacterium]|nr:guanylate kinase [Kofleriaceae bacterium]